jgi:hypothetical protein
MPPDYYGILPTKNTYSYYGNFKGSWVMNDETKFGNRGTIGIGKFSGKNRFEINANYVSKIGISTTLVFLPKPITEITTYGTDTESFSRPEN